MKNNILLLCLFLLISCSLRSQNNVGVFFYPMMDYTTSMLLYEKKIFYDGYSVGIRNNIKIHNNFSLNAGVGFGSCSYAFSEKHLGRVWGEYIPSYYKTTILRTDIQLRADILKIKTSHKFYISGGVVIIGNINEKWIWPGYPLYTVEENKFKPFNNALISLAFGLELSDAPCSIVLEPFMGYPLIQNWHPSIDLPQGFTTNTPFIYKYLLSLNIGITYFFKENKKHIL